MKKVTTRKKRTQIHTKNVTRERIDYIMRGILKILNFRAEVKIIPDFIKLIILNVSTLNGISKINEILMIQMMASIKSEDYLKVNGTPHTSHINMFEDMILIKNPQKIEINIDYALPKTICFLSFLPRYIIFLV